MLRLWQPADNLHRTVNPALQVVIVLDALGTQPSPKEFRRGLDSITAEQKPASPSYPEIGLARLPRFCCNMRRLGGNQCRVDGFTFSALA